MSSGQSQHHSQGFGRPQAFALTLVYLGVWAIIGRYYGLQHDAQVYVVQALAILRPEIYAKDLFLRFGSQSDFTLFSYLSAPWISTLGIDHGTAALTLVCLVCWLGSAWLVLRQLLDLRLAWLSIGLLLVVPGWYGAGQIFEISERFLSARLPAEALCLLAIALVLRQRKALAFASLSLALAIHPLMALPATITVWLVVFVGSLRARSVAAASVILAAACIAAGWLLGGAEPVMNGDWLRAVRSRSNFLFLDTWTSEDWQNTFITLGTLIIAASVATADSTRKLLLAATSTAIGGLLAAGVVSYLVPITVVLQGQPWRWIWVGTFLAIAVLPATLRALWINSAATRATALLLASAWILNGLDATDSALVGGRGLLLVAAIAVILLASRIPRRQQLIVLCGASTLLVVSLFWAMAILAIEAGLDFDFGGDPIWVQRLAGVLMMPSLAAIAVVAAWTTQARRPVPAMTMAIVIVGAMLLAGATPRAWARWTTESFGPEQQRAFTEWRGLIGPEQEVLWPDSLQTTWFVLERRSYLTLSQLGGIVFSPRTAAEARRRANALAPFYPPGSWFNEPTAAGSTDRILTISELQSICRASGLDFYVSSTDLGLGTPRAEWPTKGMYVYLYDCRLAIRAS